MVSYSPCGSIFPEGSEFSAPSMIRVPVGVLGGVPFAFWFAASQETDDVLKLVGSNCAGIPDEDCEELVVPQAATPMAAKPTTQRRRGKRLIGDGAAPGLEVSEVMASSLRSLSVSGRCSRIAGFPRARVTKLEVPRPMPPMSAPAVRRRRIPPVLAANSCVLQCTPPHHRVYHPLG